MEKGYVVRKDQPSIAQLRNKTQTKNCLKQITSKDKPIDLFKDYMTQDNGDLLKEDLQKWVRYKFRRFQLDKNLRKIRNLVGSKIITGSRFLMAQLKIFQIVKSIFLLEFELGLEVLIPEELRQSHLPWSYRYYDPIILLIQEKLSKDRRDFSQVKKQLGLIFDKKLSLAGQTKDLIGTKSDGPKKKKMKTQQQNVDLKKEYIDQQGDIDHHRSKHIMMLQRSNYISMQEPRKTL